MLPPWKQLLKRWHHSLYSRAILFTTIGCGCLLGAIGVQSWMMVSGTVERLLQERTSLARATGSYLEELIHHDLDQIAASLLPIFRDPPSLDIREPLRRALSSTYQGSIFQEGAFVLTPEGTPLVGVPESDPSFLKQTIDFRTLIAETREKGGIRTTAKLVFLPTGNRPVILAFSAILDTNEHLWGFIGGFIHPASNNLLKPFEKSGIASSGSIQLLDSTGTVIASTQERLLFNVGDHGSLLSGAIRTKKEIRGRCHGCHESSNHRPAREQEVLAFAPLPSLPLGIAIRQPEDAALAPAFALQDKLIILGIGFILLFLIFTGLSVYSVVSPLTRLTRAVKELETADSAQKLPSFGKDEVGQLAYAVEKWRSRVIDSLNALRTQEEVLEKEILLTQKNLSTLQDISEFGSRNVSVEAVLEKGLDSLLEFANLSRGHLRLVYRERCFQAFRGITPEQITRLEAGTQDISTETEGSSDGIRIRILEPGDPRNATEDLKTLVMANLRFREELSLACTLADTLPQQPAFEPRRIHSMLHQIVSAAANRLLHEEDAHRHQRSREFLQKTLAAQEKERKRIARELHDTIAQDLAAHRLELERLLRQTETAGDRSWTEEIKKLEHHAHDMLTGLRQLLHDLRPSVLDTMGFIPAIQWYLERTTKDHGIRGQLILEDEQFHLSPETEVVLFRIFQEGLQNVIQHAQATHLIVTVVKKDQDLEMTLEDDGEGFDPKVLEGTDRPDANRLGVLGMHERASLLGGSLSLHSAPGQGTTIVVKIPLAQKGISA